jgi:transcriptional regulator with XRE-family HTH domain
LEAIDPKRIGDRIREIRKTRDISDRDTGVSKSTLWRLETGKRRPTLVMCEKLAERLEVTIPELLGLDGAAPVHEDDFIREVKPSLKLLSRGQKAWILKTLEAAPKMDKPKRHRYARMKRAT